MNPEELQKLNNPINIALREYESQFRTHNLKFKEFPDLKVMPEKGYTAVTKVPVEIQGTNVGELVILLFQPGDGTGSEITYKLNEVIIPTQISYTEKPWRVIPRSKEGIISEGCFPLFSAKKGEEPNYFLSSLDELSFPLSDFADFGKIISPIYILGLDSKDFNKALETKREMQPKVYFTTTDAYGKRIGDPHAIHYGRDLTSFISAENIPQIIQVAGFLTITDNQSPLNKLARYWIVPNGHEATR